MSDSIKDKGQVGFPSFFEGGQEEIPAGSLLEIGPGEIAVSACPSSPFKNAELHQKDVDGRPLHEGDVVLWSCGDDDQACLIFWSGHKSAFCLKELDGWDPFCEYSYMRDGRYVVLGSSYRTPDIVDKWSRLGFRGDLGGMVRRLMPPIPDCCYPTAVMNACLANGALIQEPESLLHRLAGIGECSKWGGTIDEPVVLAEAERAFGEFGARFVPADLPDVLQAGGVVTMRLSKKVFHAAACFTRGDDTYLIGSGLMGRRIIHPLSGLESIPRSDNPAHHRDVMLLMS